MIRVVNFLMLIAVLGLIVAGCGTQTNPIESNKMSFPVNSQKIVIPDGAVFESATLNLNAIVAGNATINVYRITNGWDEMMVNWDNFGGAYDPMVWGSFAVNATGWTSVDVTDLVGSWLNGTYSNFGMLLAYDDETATRSIFNSNDAAADGPYLTYCYSMNGETICSDDIPVGDSYIWELWPLANFGASNNLRTGWGETDGVIWEKQILIQFDSDRMTELAELGDYVWFDNNRDGIQDEGEPGFPEVMVELYNCYDELQATTMTDENGYYIFSGLIPGDYYVKFIKPEGYAFTLQNIGDDATDSDADPQTGLDVCTNLEAGESDMTHDAGLYMPDMEGCSLTIGFWKNHAGFGPQEDVLSQYLPIWLGTEGGTKSLYVDNAAMAVDILVMKTYGKPSNGITKLYAQMLGAKLNMAAGADYSVIADAFDEADAFLADNDWTDWSKTMKDVIDWMSMFDDYNNGDIGPGHCD